MTGVIEIDIGIMVAILNGRAHTLRGMHSPDVAFFHRGGAYGPVGDSDDGRRIIEKVRALGYVVADVEVKV